MSGDWAGRAGTVEEAIRRRFVRRLAGVVPGTRIGRVRWPRPLPIRPWPWNYWWQAHLLDCLVDAHRRAPQPWRTVEIAALARTVRLRNLGSWTNRYYDDIAWFGLAVQRAGPLARRSAPSALAAITARLRAGWTPAGGGGIWWRRGDDFKNAPANGPAAILAARTGDLDFADHDHRLDRGHPGRSTDRPGPRRGPAQPGRNDPHRRSHHLHLLPRRVPGGVRGAGRTRR